jgi:hypothetical protein
MMNIPTTLLGLREVSWCCHFAAQGIASRPAPQMTGKSFKTMLGKAARHLSAAAAVVCLLNAAAVTYVHAEDAGLQKANFDDTILDGAYSIHDIFARLDGSGEYRVGIRQFDGEGGCFVIESNVSLFYDEDYGVSSDGTFKYDSGPSQGSIGSLGSLAFHSRRAAAQADIRVPLGYAGLRIAVARETGATKATFKGNYSYHALYAFENKDWRTVFGAVSSDGLGVFVFSPEGFQGTAHFYDVMPDGLVQIDNQDFAIGTLSANGELLFRTLEVGEDEDPQFPTGYRGLAILVRRDTNSSIADLNGRYRVHEVRVLSNHAQVAGIGTVSAAGTGVYTGSISRNGVSQNLNGSIAVNPSGTFTLDGGGFVEGTLGLNGDIAVIAKHAGFVDDGTAGETWMQVWVRTAGGAGLDSDTDGDGLSNTQETAAGTSSSDRDTDDDGIIDGLDQQPLIANNVFATSSDSLSFDVAENGEDPPAQQLGISIISNPYFQWAASEDEVWLNLSSLAGIGSGAILVSVDSAQLPTGPGPHETSITITAQGMTNSPKTIDVAVDVGPPPPQLLVTPNALTFEYFIDGPLPSAQQVTIENVAGSPYSWSATPLADWLTAEPANGTTDSTVEVRVQPQGLSTGTRSGVLRFSAEGATNNPQDVHVTFVVHPSHSHDHVWPVSPSSSGQSLASIVYDTVTKRYGVTWTESDKIRAIVLDENTFPVDGPFEISESLNGVSLRSIVVQNPAQEGFWVIWEQAQNSIAPPDLHGRPFGLPGKALGDTFTVDFAPGTQKSPAAVFNPVRNQIAIAYSNIAGNVLNVKVLRFNAFTGGLTGGGTIDPGSENQANPAIAHDPIRDEYLLAYSAQSVFLNGRIRTLRITPSGAVIENSKQTLASITGEHDVARPIYNGTRDEWGIAWQVTTVGSDVWYARFAAGVTEPVVETRNIANDVGNRASPALAYAAVANQFLSLWTNDTVSPDRVFTQRITASGLMLGPQAPIAATGPAQSDANVVLGKDGQEFVAVWTTTLNGDGQINAKRLTSGGVDDDGDGLTNEFEIQYGLDPFSAEGNDGAFGDPDGDGVSNIWEQSMTLNPSVDDTDGDGQDDGAEDFDGDGFSNALELAQGTNPVLPRDNPSFRLGDLNVDNVIDAVDVQLVINTALGLLPYNARADFDDNASVDAVDLQSTINRALGILA